MSPFPVAVVGGGNGAFITAADLAGRGFPVRLFELRHLAKNIELARSRGGIHFEVRAGLPMKGGFQRLEYVGTDPAPALAGAKVVMVVVPAFAQEHFARAIGPYLEPGQLVCLSPGNFGGALEFKRIAGQAGCPSGVSFGETECMIYSGFKDDSGSVWVSGFKNGLRFAAFPGNAIGELLGLMTDIYPSIQPANNILETGLRNVNTVFHAPIMVLNAGWIEHTKGDFLFYWHGCSSAVQRAVERVEAERMAVGRAYDLPLTPNLEVMTTWYGHQGARGSTLGEIMSTNPAYEWDTAPQTLQHRFILEDIPYGMAPMEAVARAAGIPTPVTTSIIELCQCLVDKDLRSEARDLKSLGLEGMSGDELKRFVNEGKR